MEATTKYETPRMERRETLLSPLVQGPAVSGSLPISAAFRLASYEPPRIESREPFGGTMTPIGSGLATG
jgi:hypothetical protein